MKQKQAMIKLAQIRLAINHVLRMRAMQKQAGERYNSRNKLLENSVNTALNEAAAGNENAQHWLQDPNSTTMFQDTYPSEDNYNPDTGRYTRPVKTPLPSLGPYPTVWRNYFSAPQDSFPPVENRLGYYYNDYSQPGAAYLNHNPYTGHQLPPKVIYPPSFELKDSPIRKQFDADYPKFKSLWGDSATPYNELLDYARDRQQSYQEQENNMEAYEQRRPKR